MTANSSSGVATPTPMGLDVLPVGYGFHPTDRELIINFLRPKVQGLEDGDPIIPVVEVCKIEPWDLPGYFFCLRQYKKSAHSNRRRTEKGYWKADGNARQIKAKHSKEVIGSKRTLVFHLGQPNKGSRTKWIMHEYECIPYLGSSNQQYFVLCKLKNKSDETCHQTTLNSVSENHGTVNTVSRDIFGSSHGTCYNESQGVCVNEAVGELVDVVHANSMENNYTIDSNSTSLSISNYLQNLSEQSPHIPANTPQTLHTQVTGSLQASYTSLIAIGTSQCHYQSSDNAEVISMEPQQQTNTIIKTYSNTPPDIFHTSEILGMHQAPWCDGSDKFSSFSPSGNAHSTYEFSETDTPVVSDFGYQNLDNQSDVSASVEEIKKSPSLATPSAGFGAQNLHDGSDKEIRDGLMASDLESKDELPEGFSADMVAWLDSMLEQAREDSLLQMPVCSEEIPCSLPLRPKCDSTIWSLPLGDSTIWSSPLCP